MSLPFLLKYFENGPYTLDVSPYTQPLGAWRGRNMQIFGAILHLVSIILKFGMVLGMDSVFSKSTANKMGVTTGDL